MQTVLWDKNLPALSQHDNFCMVVESMLCKAKALQVFQDSKRPDFDALQCQFPELHRRARIRNSAFKVHSFGAEDFTTKFDTLHDPRDCPNPERELQACSISRMVETVRCKDFISVSYSHEQF